MAPTAWRVKDAAGVVHVVPIVALPNGQYEVQTLAGLFVARDQHLIATQWAAHTVPYLKELVGPDELFASERVAAETERCAVVADDEAKSFRDNLAQCDSWITAGLRAVLAADRVEGIARSIREGAPK